MIEKVRELILKLNEVYSELLLLAKEKAETLKGNDHEAVSRVTEKEQAAIDLAQQLEHARLECVGALIREWKVAGESMSLSELIEKCDPREAEAMKAAAHALTDTLEALKAQNERNAQLLEIKMRMTSFILDASRVGGGDGGPGTYYNMNGTEQTQDVEARPRFIDSEI